MCFVQNHQTRPRHQHHEPSCETLHKILLVDLQDPLLTSVGMLKPTLPPLWLNNCFRYLWICKLPDVEEWLLVCCYRWHPSPLRMPGESWGCRRWSPRLRGSTRGDRARTSSWRTGVPASQAMITEAQGAGGQSLGRGPSVPTTDRITPYWLETLVIITIRIRANRELSMREYRRN